MSTTTLCFINNEYAIRKGHYFATSKNGMSDIEEFKHSLSKELQDSLIEIEIDTSDVIVTDGYIEQFILEYREFENNEEHLTTVKTVYIDLDDTFLQYSKRKKEFEIKYPDIEFVQSMPRFFADLEPFENSIDVIKKMMNDKRYEVMFATAPSIYNPHSFTEKALCIEKHFGLDAVENLIIISKKEKLDDINVFLIDDFPSGKGQDKFKKGKHLQYGTKSLPDWEAVEVYFDL